MIVLHCFQLKTKAKNTWVLGGILYLWLRVFLLKPNPFPARAQGKPPNILKEKMTIRVGPEDATPTSYIYQIMQQLISCAKLKENT